MSEILLQSMTGFGKSFGQFQGKKIAVEIRSLNSKSLDLNLKIPAVYRDLDTQIRKQITSALMRGKIDLSIYIENEHPSQTSLINEQLATAYFEQLKALNKSWESKTWGTNTQDYLSLVLRMPDVLNSQLEEISEAEADLIYNLVKQACTQLQNYRREEGKGLAKDLMQHIENIRLEMDAIVPYEKERVKQIKERIQKGLAMIDESRVDINRLEQEMIYYVEKLDISEEKQRLQQHLNYFNETLFEEASGKKLGFIAQEMGREINTLGSKCNHSEIQRRVVMMKDYLEKIKEQVLNAL